MSENEEEKIDPPTVKEAELAMRAASYAADVCKQLIETGRPETREFMGLCSTLWELQLHIDTDIDDDDLGQAFQNRADELDTLHRRQIAAERTKENPT